MDGTLQTEVGCRVLVLLVPAVSNLAAACGSVHIRAVSSHNRSATADFVIARGARPREKERTHVGRACVRACVRDA